MAKDKFRYRIIDINLKKDYIDAEKLRNTPHSSIECQMVITNGVNPAEDSIAVTTTFNCNVEQLNLVTIEVETIFYIRDLKKHVVKRNDGLELTNQNFLHYLVDLSISHLRGVQGVLLQGRMDKRVYVPLTKASKLLVDDNVVS